MRGDTVESIVDAVARAAPEIRGSLVGRRRYEPGENPSGEQQLAADVHADQVLEGRLLDLDEVASYASEERAEPVRSDAGGSYHVGLDPLDGSSNVKSNNAMGTIVGVYDEPLPAGGSSLVAACYVLYGPLTTMMVAREGSVSEYVVGDDGDRHTGTADLDLPSDPTVYGFGGGVENWTDDFTGYVEAVERELKLRYGGALIGDVNQVLTYGGIFGYPALRDRPEGKLRVQFEGIPVGAIVEAAGGASSDGSGSLLERSPSELHERTPLFVGNEAYVERLERALDD